MPRATFAGVTFDLLVRGLQDTHAGLVSVREVPGSALAGVPVAYVDVGGGQVHRRTVDVLLDDEAAYEKFAALPGTALGTATLVTDDGEQAAVLLSVTRHLRRGPDRFQLCRTEWLLLPDVPLGLEPGAPPLLPWAPTGWVVVELGDPAPVAPRLPLEAQGWKLVGRLTRLPMEGTTGWRLATMEETLPLEGTAWQLAAGVLVEGTAWELTELDAETP